jgi:hypothetical protein
MINPELMNLLETNDILDILRESVAYQLQKISNVEKTSEGRDWYQELPAIVKAKFDGHLLVPSWGWIGRPVDSCIPHPW